MTGCTAFDRNAKRTELDALCRRCHVYRLDLFGSAATGKFDRYRSDLDFLVEFDPLTPADYARAYFELMEGLGVLYGRPIDLVTQPALTNPYFRARVESERQNLYLQ